MRTGRKPRPITSRRFSGKRGDDINYRNVKAKIVQDLERKRFVEDPPTCEDGDITKGELDKSITKLSRDKAPGPDDITADWVKDLNQENRNKLLELINAWWEAEQLTDEMLEAKVASLYKKGDPDNLENYRPISLLNSFYKVIAMILKGRIEAALEDRLMKTQYGFRKRRSTTHAMYVARRIQEFAEKQVYQGQ